MFSAIITVMLAASTLALAAGGGSGDVIFSAAQEAVSFCVGIAGVICLWSGVMELMEHCGVSAALSRLLRPVLERLFPQSAGDEKILSALSENISANLMGLGNAATPAGIRAARGMAALGERGRDELCLLVVINTASIQLIPSTIAAVRASAGALSSFDIIPAVWISSAAALAVGLLTASLLRRLWK